jgi:glycosyltransferase involved in cell wall biosynthesis
VTRLGVITPGFSADDTDWCIPALAHLVRGLTEQHQVYVFALRYPPSRREYDAFGARVRPFAWGTAGAVRRPFLLARALLRIVTEGRRRRFDVLHAFWADESGYLAVLAGRLLAIPTVVSVLGGELVGFPDIGYGTQLGHAGRWLVRHALNGATRVTVGSRFLEEIARPCVHGGRMRRVPIGVDPPRFSPLADTRVEPVRLAGGFRLLHVGSLVPVKDQGSLLRAFALVAEQAPQAHLHIVGSGPLRAELERLAADLGLADRVTFHGEVRHERLSAYYRAADVCLLSSRFESQGMVVLEAAACGRLTVGTAVGVLPEIAPAACTVPVGQVAGLARSIFTLLRDPTALRRYSDECQAAVRFRYSLQGTLVQLGDLYRESRARRRAAAPGKRS